MTKTGKVGTFGGIKIPTVTIFMKGFEAGVKYYNQQNSTTVNVLGWDTATDEGLFTGNFNSTDDGQVRQIPRAGRRRHHHAGCRTGWPRLRSLLQRDRQMLDHRRGHRLVRFRPEYKEVVLTSVQKKIDVAVFNTIKDVVDGKFTGGTVTLAPQGWRRGSGSVPRFRQQGAR